MALTPQTFAATPYRRLAEGLNPFSPSAADFQALWDEVVTLSAGDSYSLGWYTNEAALISAHAVGLDGQFAVVGDTDTVWVWDATTAAWVDTGGGLGSGYEPANTTATLVQANGTRIEQQTAGIITTVWATPTYRDTLTIFNTSSGTTTINGNGKQISTPLATASTLVLNPGETALMVYNNTVWRTY